MLISQRKENSNCEASSISFFHVERIQSPSLSNKWPESLFTSQLPHIERVPNFTDEFFLFLCLASLIIFVNVVGEKVYRRGYRFPIS